jgi:hypothetical protein
MKFDHAPFDPYISVSADSHRFVNAPATHDAIALRREMQRGDAEVIGGNGYRVDYAGNGTAEMYWDALMAEARLLQLPDLLSGQWINSGGHYDRNKSEWFNTEGATGVPISILHDVVLGRIIELRLSKEVVDKYVTRKGRTVAEEEAFYRLPFNGRMNALRSGRLYDSGCHLC